MKQRSSRGLTIVRLGGSGARAGNQENHIIATVPNVKYRVEMRDGTTLEIENPVKLPPAGDIEKINFQLSRWSKAFITLNTWMT